MTREEYEKLQRRRRLQRQRQVRRQKRMLLVAALLLTAGVITTCSVVSHQRKAAKEQAKLEALEEKKKAELERKQKEIENNTIRLVAVGDNLIHENIYQSTDMTQAVWNYDHLYTNIRDTIASADLAAVNQECIFVADHSDVSAYPAFGSPVEIGDALVDTGFDIVEQASNHTYDKGTSAITETINYWKNNHPEITLLGIHDSQEAADRISTVTCKGITFSLLNYTNTVNGDKNDEVPSYMIDFLSAEKIAADVEKAKQAGEIVIAFVHAGTEYASEPDKNLKDHLQILLNHGADIAICSHPHVLQNFETLKDDQGNEMLVYYSLGNFISTQEDPKCLLGGMADITISRDLQTKELSITDSQLVPLVTHYNHEEKEYSVYKLEDYTEALAAEHSIHQITSEPFTVETLKQQYQDVLSQNYHVPD